MRSYADLMSVSGGFPLKVFPLANHLPSRDKLQTPDGLPSYLVACKCKSACKGQGHDKEEEEEIARGPWPVC